MSSPKQTLQVPSNGSFWSILTFTGQEGLQLMNETTRWLIMLIIPSYDLRNKRSCTKSYFRCWPRANWSEGKKIDEAEAGGEVLPR